MKRLMILVLLFLFLSIIVTATTVLEFNETDLINLRPKASDPDFDKMTYYFNKPLSNKGTWQTDYGDAGIYNTKVSVSDGRLITTENVTLVINKKEELPTISILAPSDKELYIIEGQDIFFNVEVSDLNDDPIRLYWMLDGETISEENFFTYTADYYSEGNHTIELLVTDGINNVSEFWNLEIEDFDRATLLDDIDSVTLNETQMVELFFPDFSLFDLEYNISEPIGNDGKWQTGYNDSGLYEVTISIHDDKGFSAEKEIKVLVEDVDRPALPLETATYWVWEDNELWIPLNYTDPDGDEVEIELGSLPEGAERRQDFIFWKPDFDVVTRYNFMDTAAGKYHVMNRVFYIDINVSSQDLTLLDQIKIRVFDTNRMPILEDIPPVTVDEGEEVTLDVKAYDPDNDTISYTFDGLANKQTFTANPGQSGTYQIKVIASDGFLEDEKYAEVKIIDVNQAPTLGEISQQFVTEGELLTVPLSTFDLDDDKLTFSVEPWLEDMWFSDSTFNWRPGLDTVSEDSTLDFNVTVSDGQETSKQGLVVDVTDVNRPPQLLKSTQIDGKEFGVGERIYLKAEVFDLDDDAITYTWQTSLFNTFETANNSIIVKYDTPGSKTVKLTATDGEEEIVRVWKFDVVKRQEIRLLRLSS